MASLFFWKIKGEIFYNIVCYNFERCRRIKYIETWIPWYSRTSMARTSLEPWKFVRDMGSSSQWGLISAPVQEANSDNFRKSFRFSTQWLYVECTHENRLDEAILTSTHNIKFHDKIRKKSLNICFLELVEGFCRDWKTSSNHPR